MDSQRNQLESKLKLIFTVLRNFDWLLDLYVLDFFIDNHWEKLPTTWRECFEHLNLQDIGEFLLIKQTNKLFPLSFLALVKCVDVLTISRERHKTEKYDANCDENQDSCKTHPRLRNLFLKHVKLKKRHEISEMAGIVVETAWQSQCNSVLDFGSGLGHLVRILAYKENLYTAGIECQEQLTKEARKLDVELEYTVSKHLSHNAMTKLRRPLHFNVTLTSHQQLGSLPLPGHMNSFGLIGLHPCGDLGPLLLKQFAETDNVRFICMVGCCFMKLTCTGENQGYPMSDYLKGIDSHLSYASREIACHAIEVYCERLRVGNYEDLKVHAYRAALERLLVNLDPKLKHAPVRSIKHTNSLTFEEYCNLATEKLNVPLSWTPSMLEQGEADLLQWKKVVILYTLRLALAPLVETAILLDRVLYVLEKVYLLVKIGQVLVGIAHEKFRTIYFILVFVVIFYNFLAILVLEILPGDRPRRFYQRPLLRD